MMMSPALNYYGVLNTYSLAEDGESLVSRSEAERVMNRCASSHEVYLDFQGVTKIGPAFAHQIFNVWRRVRPDAKILPIHTTPSVDRMIRRAQAGLAGGAQVN